MNRFYRAGIILPVMLGLACCLFAQDKKKDIPTTPASDSAMAKALDNVITPGEGQERLEFLVGTFDTKLRTWVDPSKPPVESTALAVNTWVLGKRFVQLTLKESVEGEPLNAIGYAGFDNVAKMYQTTWMDEGGTGMIWYKGGFDASGKRATLKASIPHPLTGKPSPLELRLTIDGHGDHFTELWGMGFGSKMFKMVELRFTRRK